MGKKIFIPDGADFIKSTSLDYRSLYGWDKIVKSSGEYFGHEELRRMWDSLNVTTCKSLPNPHAMTCAH